jgi:hypothetical protein
MTSIEASGLRAGPASARAILLGNAGLLALALTLAPMSVGSHGKLVGSSTAFAESSSDDQGQLQSEDTSGTDDAANHDLNDDKSADQAGNGSDDGANHDVGDDHGVDGAGHDAGDDHGGDSGNSGSGGGNSGSGGGNSGSGGGGNSGHGGGGD